MIMLAAIALNFAFKQILLDQAKLRITATSDQIVQTIDAETAGFFEEQPVVTLLGDRMTLDHWAGPTTYIQIDELNGYPIGKSSNMGSLRIPPHLDFRGSDESFEIDDDPDGGQLLVLDRLLIVNDRPAAIAHVAERLDIVRLLVRRARTILIASTIAGALVVIAASFFIARTAIDPIVRLTAAISEIGSDRLDRRIAATSEDEVGQLAGAFNAMLARLQEAFARERQFISDASHELKTPLTVINANAQLLKRWGDRDPVVLSESLDAIANESAQLAGMVSGMLTLAKADSGDAVPREPLLLGRLAAEVVAHAHDRAALKGLALTYSGSSDGPIVEGDESLLRQMINNLVDNAMKFTETGGIDVSVTANKSEATIDVADTGVGIEPEVADRLFDRFFRSDASHSRIIEGTGLGLAIVRSIARVHGGNVSAAPRPGGGSVFRVVLPILDASFTDPQ